MRVLAAAVIGIVGWNVFGGCDNNSAEQPAPENAPRPPSASGPVAGEGVETTGPEATPALEPTSAAPEPALGPEAPATTEPFRGDTVRAVRQGGTLEFGAPNDVLDRIVSRQGQPPQALLDAAGISSTENNLGCLVSVEVVTPLVDDYADAAIFRGGSTSNRGDAILIPALPMVQPDRDRIVYVGFAVMDLDQAERFEGDTLSLGLESGNGETLNGVEVGFTDVDASRTTVLRGNNFTFSNDMRVCVVQTLS